MTTDAAYVAHDTPEVEVAKSGWRNGCNLLIDVIDVQFLVLS